MSYGRTRKRLKQINAQEAGQSAEQAHDASVDAQNYAEQADQVEASYRQYVA